MLNLTFLLSTIFCCVYYSSAALKDYNGYQVFDAVPTTADDVHWFVDQMQKHVDLDFWHEPRRVNEPVTVLVPPHLVTYFSSALVNRHINYQIRKKTVTENLNRMWNEISKKDVTSKAANYTFDLNNWNRWEDIMLWMDDLVLSCDSSIICGTYITGNRTYENRYQKVLKLSTGQLGKKAYYVDAAHHAREWLTTATIVNIMDHMVRNYPSDATVKYLVDTYDWYFLPVANPDGYDYTFTTDRYWRKNRSPNDIGACPGSDLNRNYDFRWGTSGTSTNPCAYTYCGKSPMSEVETQNIAAETKRLSSILNGYISLHSYSQIWMFPWSNLLTEDGTSPQDCELAADHDELMFVANATAEATENTFNTVWTRGNACQVLYPMSGTSIDYVKAVAGVKYTQLSESRGEDFVVPVEDIPLSFQEIWNGIVAMVYAIEAVSA